MEQQLQQDSINYDRIAKAIQYIADHLKEQPALEEIAEQVHLSPFHFQRLFTEWAGVSPKKFMQFLTTNYLKTTLKATTSISEAADKAGLSGQSRVYDLFTGIEAVTPQQFKTGGAGLIIHYGYHHTPFGECFIAITERGICAMAFTDDNSKGDNFKDFSAKWNFAQLIHAPEITGEFADRIFSHQKSGATPFRMLVQGTNFQLKVWEALLRIPAGALTTYRQIAESIGHPKAMRAVGTAVGENPLAYLIPCHRVIRSEGKLGEYRWGSIRKKMIVGWEASQKKLYTKTR